jgi:hypothetical protein
MVGNALTEKYRIPARDLTAASDFIFNNTALKSDELVQSLAIQYQRITLLHKTKPEKITFDFNLKFSQEQAKADFSNLVIVEVKTERGRNMNFALLMKQLGLRCESFSKYCLGLIALHQPVKFNTFKPIYRRFAALNQAS